MCQVKYVICPDINEQVNPGSKIWLPNVRAILKPYCKHWLRSCISKLSKNAHLLIAYVICTYFVSTKFNILNHDGFLVSGGSRSARSLEFSVLFVITENLHALKQ